MDGWMDGWMDGIDRDRYIYIYRYRYRYRYKYRYTYIIMYTSAPGCRHFFLMAVRSLTHKCAVSRTGDSPVLRLWCCTWLQLWDVLSTAIRSWALPTLDRFPVTSIVGPLRLQSREQCSAQLIYEGYQPAKVKWSFTEVKWRARATGTPDLGDSTRLTNLESS